MGKFILNSNIEELLKHFYKISGIRIGVYDMDFQIIVDYPPTSANQRFSEKRFCEKCRYLSPNVYHAECDACDKEAIERIVSTGKPYMYRCKKGHFEAMVPVMSGGEVFCFLMIGQVRNYDEVKNGKRMTYQNMEGIFSQYGISEMQYPIEEAIDDYNKMPYADFETFKSYVYFLELCAQKIYNEEYVRLEQTSVSGSLMSFVKANLYNDITIKDFSEKIGLSTSYLAHSIAKEMGTTFTKYLLVCRIEEAKRILRTTEMSVKKIAVLLRYNDTSYFVRQFKKITGMTCTEYREARGVKAEK